MKTIAEEVQIRERRKTQKIEAGRYRVWGEDGTPWLITFYGRENGWRAVPEALEDGTPSESFWAHSLKDAKGGII